MSLHARTLPAGFIAPCLPTNAPQPPSGEEWLHEIKHDGFRVIARKDGKRVRLYSRPGNDLTYRFPLIIDAIAKLRSRSCIIDGEAAACGDDGIACFELIRRWDTDKSVFMWAFDLIELNGDDLRRDPLAVRKATLASVVARAAPGLRFNEHLDEEDGPLVFAHACKMGLEGIVSKRKDSRYQSGRSPHWIKSKNPNGASGETGSGGGLGQMTLKQLVEFADQNALQDYAELHGLEYAWEGTSGFRKRRRLARLSPEHYQLATVGTEHRIRRVLLFSSTIRRAELETSRRVGTPRLR